MDVAGLITRVKPVTEKHMRLTDAIGSLLQDFNMVCSTSALAKRARVSAVCRLGVPATDAYDLSARGVAASCSTLVVSEFAHLCIRYFRCLCPVLMGASGIIRPTGCFGSGLGSLSALPD